MAGLLDLDATAQAQALAAKRVSAVELLKAALTRHEQTHARLNAIVAADVERALDRARAIDDHRAKGDPLGPLAGLPMTIKDTFDVVGMPASAGVPELRRRQAEDAAAVALVRQAGAVIWGKTNVPVMAADWQSANRQYGATCNPWDPARTSGGSSGGAAAAVAACVTALEIGSDIGGSLRVPASFCGVFSHKPTWGMVSQRGHVPPSPGSHAERDLNVVGPLARSARDLRLLLSVIESGPLAPRAAGADLTTARIGVWVDEPRFFLDPEVRDGVLRLAGELGAAGATVETIPSPVDVDQLIGSYQVLLGALVAEDMPPALQRSMEFTRPLAKLAARRGAPPLSTAAMTLAYTARHTEWLSADTVRARLRHEILGLFDRFDAILAPAAPVPAFPHDDRTFQKRTLKSSDGAVRPYALMLQWIALATALKLPATTVPAGLTPSGLPVGAQLVGPPGADGRLLALAQSIDEDLRGFQPPPI